MAWLHAAPKQFKNDNDPKPRVNILSEDDPTRQLPHADSYLIKCFDLMGQCSTNGMGATALTWSDVESFSNRSGYDLNGWESEQIIMMSRKYCSMYQQSKELGYPPPYSAAASDKDARQKARDIVNARFLAMLDMQEDK